MLHTVSRTRCSRSTVAVDEISPATRMSPVLTKVSQATCAYLSFSRYASRMVSEI